MSCTKNADIVEEQYSQALRVLNQSEIIDDNMIDSIGKMHNQIMDLVLSNYNFLNVSSDNRIIRMKEAFISVSFDGAADEFEEIIYDTVQVWDVGLSDDALLYFDRIIEIIETSSNYQSIEDNLNTLKNEVESNNDIAQLDKQSIKIAISVGINSSYYWLPIDEGGSGKGQQYLAKLYPSKEMSPKTKKVVAADVFGGLSGGIGWCGSAIFGGPIGLGAYVGSILYSAAAGSLGAAAGI